MIHANNFINLEQVYYNITEFRKCSEIMRFVPKLIK